MKELIEVGDRALEAIKYRLRMGALSMIFLLLTTLVSTIFVIMPTAFSKRTIGVYDVWSVFSGALVGQVILLMAMSAVSWVQKFKPDLLGDQQDVEEEDQKDVDPEK